MGRPPLGSRLFLHYIAVPHLVAGSLSNHLGPGLRKQQDQNARAQISYGEKIFSNIHPFILHKDNISSQARSHRLHSHQIRCNPIGLYADCIMGVLYTCIYVLLHSRCDQKLQHCCCRLLWLKVLIEVVSSMKKNKPRYTHIDIYFKQQSVPSSI